MTTTPTMLSHPSHSSTAPKINFTSNDHFLITNDGTAAITFKMPRRKYVIQPGQWAEVTFSLVRIYFGDPRSIAGSKRLFKDGGGEGTIASREEEVARLKILYGVYSEDTPHFKKLEEAAPNCTIKTLTGQTVIPPIYDRLGTHSQAVIAKSTEDITSIMDVTALLKQHEEAIANLNRLAESIQINGPNDGQDVMVDEPPIDLT